MLPQYLVCGRDDYVGPNGESSCSEATLSKEDLAYNILERTAQSASTKEMQQLKCPRGYDRADLPTTINGVKFNQSGLGGNKKGLVQYTILLTFLCNRMKSY